MEELLFLSHRIPYPPNKGDKIRSYHLLKALAAEYRVHVGTFIDDPVDWQHLDRLQELVAGEVKALKLDPLLAKIRGLSGLWRREPITLPYYRDSVMRSWVREILEQRSITRIVVYSSGVAPLVWDDTLCKGVRRIIDFVDVDSQKWRQYSREHSGIMGWIYRREGKLLLHHERAVAAKFDASLFVSKEEAR
ncbi:MAG: sugar transferase, partial [Magnetococcales bacterium]|nr:sugar transferase [Magnetococcales bacterium]